jgi:DNA-binding CsgD family transcriptional regulator
MQMTQGQRKQKLISYCEKFPIDDIPGITTILTEDNSFVRVSKTGLSLCGYKTEDEIYDLHYADLKSDVAKSHEIFENDNNISMRERKTIKIISCQNFATGMRVLNGHQKPLIDKETNQVIGIIHNFIDITEGSFLDVKKLISIENNRHKRKQFQYKMPEKKEGYAGLSERELEIVFLRYNGCTFVEIAKRLSTKENPLEPVTVRSYMARVRAKLNVKSNEELLEKCVSIGIMGILPPSLFTYSNIN